MKPSTKTFSTLSAWGHLMDRQTGQRLKAKEFTTLRWAGFNEDKVSFQLEIVRRMHTRDIPEWTADNKFLGVLTSSVFPKMHMSDVNRSKARAARWLRVVYLHWRTELSLPEICEEMGLSVPAVKSILKRARQKAEEVLAKD